MLAGCDAWTFLSYKYAPDAPGYSGSLTVETLGAPVEVVFDRYAVPHITAQNEEDLFFAVGYVQARERLFQMILLRAVSQGRLAELFGNESQGEDKLFSDLLTVDRWFRVIGLSRHGRQAVARMNEKHRALGERYVAGVNEAMRRETRPIELRLLKHEPEPWTLEDTMTIARLQGWTLLTNMPHELIRFMLALELGDDVAEETFPARYDHPGRYIINRKDKDYRPVAAAWNEDAAEPAPVSASAYPEYRDVALRLLAIETHVRDVAYGMASPAASNSFAVAPSRTKSGKALIANDPHLEHHAPGIFYLMHFTAPGLDAMGATMPGAPLIVTGRNRDVVWTATTTFADMQDVYLEKIDPTDPSRYLTENGPVPFEVEEQIVREKLDDGAFREHPMTLRRTRHGPVLNDAAGMIPDGAPIMAMKTTMENAGGDVDALSRLARARSVEEFRDAFTYWEVPIQNWTAADRDGHIGYFPAGRAPLRRNYDGMKPVPGWTGTYEWDGFIPPDRIPQMFDPPSGMIVTANNHVLPPEDYPWPFCSDPMPPYRADRIAEMILETPKLDAKDMARIQIDTYAKQGERLAPVMIGAIRGEDLTEVESRALGWLHAWDYRTNTTSPARRFFT
ncbi:MAG: penicillin acylase family protein [Deltaproteobacteria bacterium]|nr:penicillin acylase family protein [Deltaproteobacteria bacterium]